MAIDSSIAVKRAIVATAKADAALIALVPARDIYGQTVKAAHGWPFIRSGAPSATPLRAAGVDGGEWLVAMHAFAKDRMDGKKALETAEDFAGRIGAALCAALDKQVIAIPRGRVRVIWTGSQLLEDPDEAGCFHSVQSFRVRALTA